VSLRAASKRKDLRNENGHAKCMAAKRTDIGIPIVRPSRKGRCSSEAAAITTDICCGNARPFRVPKRRERPLGTEEHRQLGPAETRAPVRMNRFRGDVILLRNKKKERKRKRKKRNPPPAPPRDPAFPYLFLSPFFPFLLFSSLRFLRTFFFC